MKILTFLHNKPNSKWFKKTIGVGMKIDIFVLLILITFTISCSAIKRNMYSVGITNADTSRLDKDEKEFFFENRPYLTRNDVKAWLYENDRAKRDQIFLTKELAKLAQNNKNNTNAVSTIPETIIIDTKNLFQRCINKEKHIESCLALEKHLEQNNNQSLSDIAKNKKEVMSYDDILCKRHPITERKVLYCKLVIIDSASIICNEKPNSKECSSLLPRVKRAGFIDAAITLAENSCTQGNSISCQYLQTLQSEKGNKARDIAENRRFSYQEERDNVMDRREEEKTRHEMIEKMHRAFTPPKTVCDSKRTYNGIETECVSK
jgi:hypothetical protein